LDEFNSAFEVAYKELHSLASNHFLRESKAHTLQPTALVNEVFLKLSKQTQSTLKSHEHLLATASHAMRHVLVDYARQKKAIKRGGKAQARLTLSDMDSKNTQWDVLELNDALDRLNVLEPRQAEIVELRFFGGLTVNQAATVLDVSERTVYLDWQMAKAWLWSTLRQGNR